MSNVGVFRKTHELLTLHGWRNTTSTFRARNADQSPGDTTPGSPAPPVRSGAFAYLKEAPWQPLLADS